MGIEVKLGWSEMKVGVVMWPKLEYFLFSLTRPAHQKWPNPIFFRFGNGFFLPFPKFLLSI